MYQPAPEPTRNELIWAIIEQHFDEADFLSEQLSRALDDHAYDAHDATALESRLHAHVDGLVLAGQSAVDELLVPALAEGVEPGRVTAAVLVLLERPSDADITRVFDAAGNVSVEPLARACAWAQRCRALDARLAREISQQPSAADVWLLPICAARGLPAGDRTCRGLGSGDPALQLAAANAARWHTDFACIDQLEALAALEDANGEVALTSALVQSSTVAWKQLSRRAERGDRFGMWGLAALGDNRARDWIVEQLHDPAMRVAAVEALGWSGRASDVEALLPWLADAQVARLAGEAVAAVLGIRSSQEAFWLADDAREEDDELLPLADDLSAPMVDGSRKLSAPNPSAFEEYWHVHKNAYAPGVRHIHGEPLDLQSACVHLQRGLPTRRRHRLADELAVRSQGRIRCSTYRLPSYQIAYFASKRDAGVVDLQTGHRF